MRRKALSLVFQFDGTEVAIDLYTLFPGAKRRTESRSDCCDGKAQTKRICSTCGNECKVHSVLPVDCVTSVPAPKLERSSIVRIDSVELMSDSVWPCSCYYSAAPTKSPKSAELARLLRRLPMGIWMRATAQQQHAIWSIGNAVLIGRLHGDPQPVLLGDENDNALSLSACRRILSRFTPPALPAAKRKRLAK